MRTAEGLRIARDAGASGRHSAQNPGTRKCLKMFDCIRQDFRRCGHSFYNRLKEVLFNPAMWAVINYRLIRWIRITLPRSVRRVLAILMIPMQIGMQLLTHVQMSHDVQIGPGLYLPHVGFIVVGSGTEIGSNCTIAHGVTVGHGGGRVKSARSAAIIGSRVYIGPGAMILGAITIGDDALIGAGAVVVTSVPPRGVVFGNPARLISHSGSFDLIEYPGMENDPDRMASMMERKTADSIHA
jgi:serine O-acetyltransferase